MTHIHVSKLTTIGLDNGLSPGRRQAIIWTNDGILLIRTSGTNFSEILSGIHTFSFKKMHLKTSAKWRPFCLGLNVLSATPHDYTTRLQSSRSSHICLTYGDLEARWFLQRFFDNYWFSIRHKVSMNRPIQEFIYRDFARYIGISSVINASPSYENNWLKTSISCTPWIHLSPI